MTLLDVHFEAIRAATDVEELIIITAEVSVFSTRYSEKEKQEVMGAIKYRLREIRNGQQ